MGNLLTRCLTIVAAPKRNLSGLEEMRGFENGNYGKPDMDEMLCFSNVAPLRLTVWGPVVQDLPQFA